MILRSVPSPGPEGRQRADSGKPRVIAFQWHFNPVLWTYTTVPGAAGRKSPTEKIKGSKGIGVLIGEPDPAVRQALAWCVDRQAGFRPVNGESEEACRRTLKAGQPLLFLLNSVWAPRFGLKSPGGLAAIGENIPALPYSVHAGGDAMFASAPDGANGYGFRPVRPERLFEPFLGAVSFEIPHLLSRVADYFHRLLPGDATVRGRQLRKLTLREIDVLVLLSRGFADKEIAHMLGLSPWTAHRHVKRILCCLRARTRTEAAIHYLSRRYLGTKLEPRRTHSL